MDDTVITNICAQFWITRFTQLLGEGYTVNNAKCQAFDDMVSANLSAYHYTRYELDRGLIPEPAKTESILCGIDSCYIAGDKNQVVKH